MEVRQYWAIEYGLSFITDVGNAVSNFRVGVRVDISRTIHNV